MRHIPIFTIFIIFLSCSNKRQGIPEEQRNYSEAAFSKGDTACMTASDGIFLFHNINADSISNSIHNATVKYFDNNFSTTSIQDSIKNWLTKDYFSGKTYTNQSWSLKADIDKSKLSCNYKSLYGLENLNINLFFENKICLKKFIAYIGTYEFEEQRNNLTYRIEKNRLRFLCDFNIDIHYKPTSLLNTSKKEYYRATITDTVDLFTVLADSNFIYK